MFSTLLEQYYFDSIPYLAYFSTTLGFSGLSEKCVRGMQLTKSLSSYDLRFF